MDTRSAKRYYQLQQWRTIIQERNNSGLTIDEYCSQNGLSRNSYFYWLRLVREELLDPQQSTSGFVELSLPVENSATVSGTTPYLHRKWNLHSSHFRLMVL